MKLVVSGNNEEPIYEQIKRQILHAVLHAELLPGEMLPSLRALARELKVGVLTVNRAYTELESEGYIENVQGKGCYVTKRSQELILEHLTGESVKKMEMAIREIKKAGVPDEEILALFTQCLRRITNE